MNKKISFYLIIIFCVLISFIYRNRSYTSFPPVYDTFDEFAAGWSGLSLLRSGIPTSWSYISDYSFGIPKNAKLDLIETNIFLNNKKPQIDNYKNFPKPLLLTRELTLDGYTSHFNIVSPYLEQPPLGGIIIAMPAFLSGIKNFKDVTLKILRQQFVFLGVLSTLILILLTKELFGNKIALITGIIYATVPTVVIGSRLALPENILTFLMILEVFLILKKSKFAYLIVFIAPLIKPFGLACALIGVFYYLLVEKNKKQAIIFLLLGVVSFLSYIFYGMVVDKTTFLMVLKYQSSRFFAGPDVFLLKIIVPKITKIFLDGWIFFGWISVFILAFSKDFKKYSLILVPIISYVIVLSFFGGEDYGWYRTPLYPFLILAASLVIYDIYKNSNFVSSILFAFAVFFPNLTWGLNIYNWSDHLGLFRIILLVSICFLFLKKTRKLTLVIMVTFAIFINTRIINNEGEFWPYLGDSSSLIMERK